MTAPTTTTARAQLAVHDSGSGDCRARNPWSPATRPVRRPLPRLVERQHHPAPALVVEGEPRPSASDSFEGSNRDGLGSLAHERTPRDRCGRARCHKGEAIRIRRNLFGCTPSEWQESEGADPHRATDGGVGPELPLGRGQQVRRGQRHRAGTDHAEAESHLDSARQSDCHARQPPEPPAGLAIGWSAAPRPVAEGIEARMHFAPLENGGAERRLGGQPEWPEQRGGAGDTGRGEPVPSRGVR